MSRLYDLESRAEDLVMIAAPIRIQGRGKVLGEGAHKGVVNPKKRLDHYNP